LKEEAIREGGGVLSELVDGRTIRENLSETKSNIREQKVWRTIEITIIKELSEKDTF